MNQTLTQRVQPILSSKTFGWFAVTFAVAARAIQLIYFFNIRSDASFQFLATQNLVKGHGLTIAQVHPSALSTIEYTHVVQWPPGFSVIVAPFYLLFNSYVIAGLLLQFLAAVLLIFTSRGILRTLNASTANVNLFTILASLYIYPFYFLCCSDAIAISFFFLGFHQALLVLKKETVSLSNYLWLCVGLFIAAFIKYLFIPVVFVVPAFLYLRGKISRQKQVMQAGIVSFRVIAFAIAIVLFYQKFTAGSATYISEPERGWYSSNLSAFYPYLPSSILQATTLSIFQSASFQKITPGFYRAIHILSLLLIVYFFARDLFRKRFRGNSLKDDFIQLSVFIALTITLLLTALSLIVAKENINTSPWTYVEEARYYGVILVLVHLALFGFYNAVKNKWLNKFMLLLILLLAVESSRGLIFTMNRIINFNKEEYSWQYELRFQQYADNILRAQKEKFQTSDAVVAGSSYYMNHRIALYSRIPVMYDAGGLNEFPTVAATKPTMLLVVLHGDKLPLYSAFLRERSAQLAGQFDEFYFYAVYVPAD